VAVRPRSVGDVVSPAADFWAGRRVYLTGHTGFKGGWLSLWLQSWGAEVTGYALPPATEPSLFDVIGLGHSMRSEFGDVRDFPELLRSVSAAQPEIVFHLAAQSLVLSSYEDPITTVATNVLGTVHVLEAIRRTPSVRAAVIVTSDKCYENREWYWGYREDEAMGGRDPYSSSKGCAELVTAAYRNSFFVNASGQNSRCAVATARAGNVIGGGDWARDRLVPDLCRAFAAGKSAEIRNPSAVRPWQHVLDPLAGYITLAHGLAEDCSYAQGWNFGPAADDAKAVEWVARKAADAWGEGAQWHAAEHDAAAPHEARYLKLDCSKANTLLGWFPTWRIGSAIERTVDWYKAHARHAEMRDFSIGQLQDYLASISAGAVSVNHDKGGTHSQPQGTPL
jgi:CDP-glucose 4,6-dehydratase